jgi:hypothetical protein
MHQVLVRNFMRALYHLCKLSIWTIPYINPALKQSGFLRQVLELVNPEVYLVAGGFVPEVETVPKECSRLAWAGQSQLEPPGASGWIEGRYRSTGWRCGRGHHRVRVHERINQPDD